MLSSPVWPSTAPHSCGYEKAAEDYERVRPSYPMAALGALATELDHAAYYSEEAIRTVRDFAAREVVRVLTGQQPISPVNAGQLA